MQEIKGYVEHIIYRNEENTYTVFEVNCEDGILTCTGFPPAISEGESCLVSGEVVQHAVYGEQFKVDSYRVIPPENAQAMLRYLSSGAVKGIGQALAARIIKMFGDETLRIMDGGSASERPARSPLSWRRSATCATRCSSCSSTASLTASRSRSGRPMASACIPCSRTTPISLRKTSAGSDFQPLTRSQPGPASVPSLSSGSGAAFCIHFLLHWRRAAVTCPGKSSCRGLPSSCRFPMTFWRSRWTIWPWREGSGSAGKAMRSRSIPTRHGGRSSRSRARMGGRDPEEVLRELEREENLELDPLQREAVLMAAEHAILIISGGPGTGKTTTINTIIRYLRSENLEVLLAAPTGRAAKRMTEATGYEAMTIHRLLGVRAVRDDGDDVFAAADDGDRNAGISFSYFEKGADNPLEADAVIIDEMSMVDMHLFYSFLKAVTPGTRLILVGDVNQLPSVGPGRVLQDLIASGVFRTVMLRKIFRQALESDIVTNAHRILNGEVPEMGNKSRDFFFLERDNPPVIYKHTVELMRDKLPGYLHCDTGEIQVLTPMRKGPLGVSRLNEVLQSVLNPPAKGKREVKRQDITFREGDKVMQTRNNYQIEWVIRGNYGLKVDSGTGVFNGDAGVITEIDTDAEILTVCFDEEKMVEYPFSDLDDLEPAYAVTVHKSQGSEYPAVILPLLSGPAGLFNRNLLYTAVTRARDCVVILGSRQAVANMTANVRENRRYTGLKERIHEIFGVTDSGTGPAFSKEMPCL